ncbi:MAG TPA: long-chain fatty acid--CoA ligase [Planctomycetes bacterium]|nr:long-chain fatty acid--CoA ligase [Fuerstiella sp.]HIK93045.1 long-chain fatty acid--CoA ligase [Planctomycetota bacterium]
MNKATLCAMHRSAARSLGPRTALRYKQDGIWRDLSWNDFRQQADRAAFGLLQLGVELGDRVAVLSENRAEWVVADQALLSAGAASVTMHAPLTPPQVAFQVSHSQSKGIIVSGYDEARKVVEVLDQLPDLEFLVSFEPLPSTLQTCRPVQTYTWQELVHLARPHDDWQQALLQREAQVTADDPATVIYTSGTTGDPKGVVLTHKNLLTNAASTGDAGNYGPSDVFLSWLPYSHIYARTVDLYVTMSTWGTLCVGGPIDDLLDDFSQTHPTWMTAVPRFYEKLWTSVEGLPLDERRTELRRLLGPRLTHLSSGGAPLPKHIAAGFLECDIPLYQGYGLTESSPVISFNNRGQNRLGSVGLPLPGVEVRIAEDGEILTRGAHVMKGYWRNDEATREAIIDGWLYTGDIGFLDDDGYLFITDRKKDIIVTSSGKNIAPTEVERLLISDPMIDQAVVYGDARPFLTALIVPARCLLEEEIRRRHWSIDVDGDFITSGNIHEFFAARIAAVMQSLSRPEQVREFLLLNRTFSHDRDELTATLKVRRRVILKTFEDQLSALYGR